MSKFKEITSEDKIQKSMKIQKLSCLKPAHHCRANYPIIDNISLSYNLVEHYVSQFLPKKIEEIEIDVRDLHYVRCSKYGKPLKEAAYIYCQIFINSVFLRLKWILKKNNYYSRTRG
jgi:hypothetical protein